MKIEEFSLIINSKGIIIGSGKSIAKAADQCILEKRFFDYFEITYPAFLGDKECLDSYVEKIIIVRYIFKPALQLRGIIKKNNENYIFSGTLWANDISVMSKLNLTFADFSPLDPTPDFILLLDTKERAYTQSIELANELRELRDTLESRIKARVADLEMANSALESSKIASENLARQVTSMAKLRELLEEQVIKTAERERIRLGLDLHDGLLQQLTGVALYLTSFAKRLSDNNNDISLELDRCAGYIRDAINTSRNLVRGLLPVEIKAIRIQHLFSELAEMITSLYGIKCQVYSTETPHLSDRVARHLYYIAREAVFNSAKHSGAKNIKIDFKKVSGGILLKIIDDGDAWKFRNTKKTGHGIENMKLRARIVNAYIRIATNKKSGTVVTCKLSEYGLT